MWCMLLFYNSQPYIVDPYIAASFGEEKTIFYQGTAKLPLTIVV